jgi:hypothetical protein
MDFNKIYQEQTDFQYKYTDKFSQIKADPKLKQDYINQQFLALMDEISEALRETRWKDKDINIHGWKKQTFNTKEFKLELIDIFKFLMNLFIVTGTTANEIEELFYNKTKEVHNRPERAEESKTPFCANKRVLNEGKKDQKETKLEEPTIENIKELAAFLINEDEKKKKAEKEADKNDSDFISSDNQLLDILLIDPDIVHNTDMLHKFINNLSLKGLKKVFLALENDKTEIKDTETYTKIIIGLIDAKEKAIEEGQNPDTVKFKHATMSDAMSHFKENPEDKIINILK